MKRIPLLAAAICLVALQFGAPAPARAEPFVTSTILSSSVNPALSGASVTLTATVIGESPTGIVTFMDGAETLGSATLAGPRATLPLASLAEGLHTLTAVFSGDAGHTTSTSLALLQSVSRTAGVIAAAGGSLYGVAVRADGSVTGWSDNEYGMLTFPESAVSGVVAIAAGSSHTAALKDDGSVVVWGANDRGQVSVPPEAASGVRAIAAGWKHTLALKEDGAVIAWGDDTYGECTIPASATTGVIAIAAGGDHSVALKSDGSVVIWGSFSQWVVPDVASSNVVAIAASDNLTVALKNDGSVVTWPRSGSTRVPPAMTSGVIAIAQGQWHTVALKSDGSVVSEGSGFGWPNTPQPPSASSGVVAVSAGGYLALAIKEDGSLLAWGWDERGQLDVPYLAAEIVPSGELPPGGTIAFTASPGGLDCSWDGTAATGRCDAAQILKGTKVVVTAHPSPGVFVGSWGRGCDVVTPTTCTIESLAGDLSLAPVVAAGAPALPGAPSIGSATPDDTRALVHFTPRPGDEDRVLWYTVTSSGGETGEGATSPILVSGLSNYSSYTFTVTATNAAGSGPASAVSKSVVPMPRRTLLAASANPVPPGVPVTLTATVLGDDPTGTVTIREEDATLAVLPLAGGRASFTTSALMAGRHVLTASYDGDEANPASASIPLTLSVNTHAEVVAIAAGAYHSVAITREGSVVAWGRNDSGQTTVPPAATSGIVGIAAGETFTAALKNDGSVVVWGRGSQPVPPEASTGVVAIAAGTYCVFALKVDGSVVAWGHDGGPLTPPAAATAGVVAVDGGYGHAVALKDDGSVIGWGYDAYGQATPTPAAAGGLVAVAAGEFTTAGLRGDGSVLVWGMPRYDQFSVPPAASSGVTAVTAGFGHVVTRKGDGSLVAWGRNADGESSIPAAARSEVVAVAAGWYHTLALKEDGTVVAWGWNDFGQTAVPYHRVAVAAAGALRPGDVLRVVAEADGIDCAWDGTASAGACLSLPLIAATRVVLKATLPPHTAIDSWGVGCDATTADSCTIDRLAGDVTIAPVVRVEPVLVVTVVPEVGGAVTAEGIDCPGTCTGIFHDVAATAHLVATPAAGYTFLRWEEDAAGSTTTQELPMAADRRVTALFATTRSVCAEGCEHGGIQEALDAAGTGDTIAVAPGVWRGNLVLDPAKEITLRGSGASPGETVLSGDSDPGTAGGDGSVLALTATDGIAARIRIENLTLTGGTALCGGGLRAEASGSGDLNLALARVKVHGNAALPGGTGGGICARATGGGSLALSLENVMVTGNEADAGGGIAALADGAGSALALAMMNDTVGGNRAASGGGLSLLAQDGADLSARVVNSVLAGSRAASGRDLRLEETGGATARVEAGFSDIQDAFVASGTLIPGEGVLAASAIYRNPAKGDCRLNADSPCVDAGTPEGAPSLDLEGDSRPQGAGFDLGADELVPRNPPRLALLALTGRETIRGGEMYDITWEAPAKMTRFKVSWSKDGGKSWALLATVHGAGRHYGWTPPRKNLAACRIMVKGYDWRGVLVSTVKSARNFTITR